MVASIVAVAVAVAWVIVTVVRRVGKLPAEAGPWSRLLDRWDWKPFRPMFVVVAAALFVLTVKLLDSFFGLLGAVLPEDMPAEAQWYIDGAIAGALFMAVVLIIATGYNAFAGAMGALTKDDERAPADDPDRVAQVLEFANSVHERDSHRFRELFANMRVEAPPDKADDAPKA